MGSGILSEDKSHSKQVRRHHVKCISSGELLQQDWPGMPDWGHKMRDGQLLTSWDAALYGVLYINPAIICAE
jgi:hypothetical protein